MWADPGGTAMPGQPVTRSKQAQTLIRLQKYVQSHTGGVRRVPAIKLIRTDTTL
uniref:Uncharacterized protein n=1 Tax=Tetranychus urticae TaxID=32264 RepID=T1KYR7_TETUR